MTTGLPVDRQWVLVMPNGDIVVDWGDQRLQDVHSGQFLSEYPPAEAVVIPDALLEILKAGGIVSAYNRRTVYFTYLPEHPTPLIN